MERGFAKGDIKFGKRGGMRMIGGGGSGRTMIKIEDGGWKVRQSLGGENQLGVKEKGGSKGCYVVHLKF